MKVIKTISSRDEMEQSYLDWIKMKASVIIWQQKTNGERCQTKVQVLPTSDTPPKLSFVLRSNDWDLEKSFNFSVPSENLIFKSTYHDWEPGRIIFKWPEQMLMIQEDQGFQQQQKKMLEKDYMRVKSLSSSDRGQLLRDLGFVALEKEDEKYASLREAPRNRPQTMKRVLLLMENRTSLYDDLYDLSRGGLGIITKTPLVYTLSTKVQVLSIDDTPLDGELLAEIVSIKEVPVNRELFKVGLKFI